MKKKSNPIPDAIKPIWRALAFVQAGNGLAFGLYLFTFGPWFFDHFGGNANAATAMMLTSILLGVRQGGVAVLEAPTGAIADAIGRVHAVTWSWCFRVFFFVGLASLSLCTSISIAFVCGVLASIAYSLSYTFYSGALSAWTVDSCKQIDPSFEYGILLSKGHSINLWGQFLGGILGMCFFLQGITHVAYIIGALLSFVVMAYCMQEMPETPGIAFLGLKGTFISALRRIGERLAAAGVLLKKMPTLASLIFVYAAMLFLVNVVDYFWPLAVREELGISDRQYLWLGFLSVLCLTRIFGARGMLTLLRRVKHLPILQQRIALRRWLTGLCFISSTAVVGLGWNNYNGHASFVAVMCVVLTVALTYGFLVPCFETLLNHYIPAEYATSRATILSFGSLARSALLLILSVPAGGHSSSTTTRGWLVPASLVIISALIARFVLKRTERRAIVADVLPTTETPT